MSQILARLQRLERQRQKEQADPPPSIIEVHLCCDGEPSGLAEVYDRSMKLLGLLVDNQPADEATFSTTLAAKLGDRGFGGL